MNVVLIIFNRPEYTQKVFDVIRHAQPKRLFVIADGPRTESERALCNQTRSITEAINWDCEVTRDYSEKNLGVRTRIETGLDNVFSKVDRAIILEDDCVPDPSFFPFATIMLDQYANDTRVMMISGSNPLQDFPIKESYTFSRYFSIWGWATWRRAWSLYDRDMREWPEHKKAKDIYAKYQHRGAARGITDLFDKAYSHAINSWATRWFYTCLFRDALNIVPAVNLISNIGVIGVHSSPGINNNVPLSSLDTEHLVHPVAITENKAYDRAFFDTSFPSEFKPAETLRWLTLRGLVHAKDFVRKIPLINKYLT